MTKNYGFNKELEIQSQDGSEWVFGGFSQPCIASIPESEREKYLPKGEIQRGKDDFMDCASRGPINILEAKFTYLLQNKKLIPNNEKWLKDNGYVEGDRVLFSDTFIAIKSGTTKSGNSIKAPLQAIENFGLIPKKLLPVRSDMTWDEYHDPKRITPEMETLGRQFKERFTINYEKVLETHYAELLKDDFLNVAGYAWPTPKNGEYPRVDKQPNHVWVNFVRLYYAFDNYVDFDGDFIKKLASNYDFYEYGYRVFISKQEDVEAQISVIQQILAKLFQFLGLIKKAEPQIISSPVITTEHEPPKYDWDTPVLARHSVRVIADEEGLTVEQKNTLCATVGAESGWKPDAIGKKNSNGTRDWGICQINDALWIGEGKDFPTTAYVLANPEACIRWMCKWWKKGKRTWWIAYKNGSYKKYL